MMKTSLLFFDPQLIDCLDYTTEFVTVRKVVVNDILTT